MAAVGPKIVPVMLRFSAAFLVKERSIILIDTGMPGNGPALLQEISALGKPNDLSLVVITHGHMDHIGSLPQVKEATGAKVMIHSQDRVALIHGRKESHVQGFFPKLLRGVMRGRGDWKTVEPDVVIEGETDLGEFGVNATVIPTPGHTMGSISVLLPWGEAFVGDLIGGRLGNATKPNYPFFVEDKAKVAESARALLNRGARVFYAAHGGPFSAEDVSRRFLS